MANVSASRLRQTLLLPVNLAQHKCNNSPEGHNNLKGNTSTEYTGPNSLAATTTTTATDRNDSGSRNSAVVIRRKPIPTLISLAGARYHAENEKGLGYD